MVWEHQNASPAVKKRESCWFSVSFVLKISHSRHKNKLKLVRSFTCQIKKETNIYRFKTLFLLLELVFVVPFDIQNLKFYATLCFVSCTSKEAMRFLQHILLQSTPLQVFDSLLHNDFSIVIVMQRQAISLFHFSFLHFTTSLLVGIWRVNILFLI